MTTTDIAVTVGSGVAIATLTQFCKVWLEKMGLNPKDAVHDITIQVLAGVIGILGFCLHQAMTATLTGNTAWDPVSQGFLAGVSAVFTYHIITGGVPYTGGASTAVEEPVIPH